MFTYFRHAVEYINFSLKFQICCGILFLLTLVRLGIFFSCVSVSIFSSLIIDDIKQDVFSGILVFCMVFSINNRNPRSEISKFKILFQFLVITFALICCLLLPHESSQTTRNKFVYCYFSLHHRSNNLCNAMTLFCILLSLFQYIH